MTVVEEYLEKDQYYKRKFGERTFFLYQVGTFFEVYGVENDKSYENICAVTEMCNLACVKKSGSFVDSKSIYMAGFRDYLLEKYVEKIQSHGYTIVVYVQQENGAGGFKRVLHRVYSPGTTFLEESSSLSNHMSCIWIQKMKTLNQDKYIFGLSTIHIMTGHSYLSEHYETYYHNPTTYDSIETFLNIYNPTEFVLIHNVGMNVIQGIVQYLNVCSKKFHVIDLNNNDHPLSIQARHCEDQVYQKEIIRTFFPKMNIDIFNYDIEDKPIALQSYCFLLNFIQQHNVSLIEKISEPKIEQVSDLLVCANHSFSQLNIIHEEDNGSYYKNNQVTSIMALLNQCKTKMGKRHMNELMLHPINNHEKLKEQYEVVDYMIQKELGFNDELAHMADLEKLLTKLKLQKLCPHDFHAIYQSHVWFRTLCEKLPKKKHAYLRKVFQVSSVFDKYDAFMEYMNQTFDMSTCERITTLNFEKYDDITPVLFQRGVNEELDQLIQENMENKDKLNALLQELELHFSKKDKDQSKYIKQNQCASGEVSLLVTKKRANVLDKNIKQLRMKSEIEITFLSSFDETLKSFSFDLKDIYVKDYNKSNCVLCSPVIDQLLSHIYNNNIAYYEILQKTYKTVLSHVYDVFFDHLIHLIQCVRDMDLYNTKVNMAKQYNLCKPEIQSHSCSFVDAKKMRHLLIECLDKNEIYVPNDICLGRDKSQTGILLYGTNAVGKTSLIKALGICVIMAQSGFYVPCESFVYCPYQYIFTRIIGNDNLFKGLSTFGVEMSELRVILQMANQNSLILGDELCSGTEIDSALSIFISSLETLSQRQSTFIFATHFHELQQMQEMKQLPNICCKHLKVQFDYEKQQLYYDRKLQDGQGESIYGLEVCKSLKLPESFLTRCYEIRNEYIQNKNNILLLKTSKYNKDKLRNVCEFCNENMGTEIHHMQYQKDANKNDYIENSFHKNHSANLASVCQKCHQHIHALNLKFERKKNMDGNYELFLKKIEYKNE